MKTKTIILSEETIKIILVTFVGIGILILVTIIAYFYAKKRTPSVILPGGITYLGPSTSAPAPASVPGKIPISPNASWSTYLGKIYPYTFSYPASLSIGVFPNDPFDSVTVFWNDTNPQENVFLRVENLNKLKGMSKYIALPKKEYASVWWKQYAWKGVSSIVEFTNSHDLKGYRAKYVDASGETPYDNVFFEVPQQPQLVIWLGGKLFDDAVFDKIIQSVNWVRK